MNLATQRHSQLMPVQWLIITVTERKLFDNVDYENLTISGGNDNVKTASGGFVMTGDLTVDADTELAFDFATDATVSVGGDTAVSGTLSFSGAGAGTLELYGLNNDLGTFNYHTLNR